MSIQMELLFSEVLFSMQKNAIYPDSKKQFNFDIFFIAGDQMSLLVFDRKAQVFLLLK